MGADIAKFKLVPYTVSIKQKRSSDYFNLDNIGNNNIDFLDIFLDFLGKSKHIVLPQSERTVSIHRKENDGRDVYGVFKSGQYNILADFLDISDEDKFELKEEARGLRDSEVYPFFFLMNIPNKSPKGILILQTFSIHRIKTVIEKAINTFLAEDKDPEKYDKNELKMYDELKNMVVEIKPLISESLLEKLNSAESMQTISLVRHKVPVNTTKKLWFAKKGKKELIGDPEEITEIHTFKVKSKSKHSLYKDKMVEAIKNVENTYGEIFEDKYDEIHITVNIDGSEQSIILGSRNEFKEVFPLSDKTLVLENGFPEYNYMKKTSKGYLKYLNK